MSKSLTLPSYQQRCKGRFQGDQRLVEAAVQDPLRGFITRQSLLFRSTRYVAIGCKYLNTLTLERRYLGAREIDKRPIR